MTFRVEIRYLDVKKQFEKCDYFASCLKCNKQCPCIALRYLQVINLQEKLKEVKKGTKKCFKGCETLSKVKEDNVCGAKIERR